jgi:hypothetical protein
MMGVSGLGAKPIRVIMIFMLDFLIFSWGVQLGSVGGFRWGVRWGGGSVGGRGSIFGAT